MNLREAAQQALEALSDFDYDKRLAAITALRAALAEPVQEPVAHLWQHSETGRTRVVMPDQIVTTDATWVVVGPLYTAPPQHKPLTDEEILKAVGWERAEMYMKLTPNFPVAEAKKETLKNARAIERALGIRGEE